MTDPFDALATPVEPQAPRPAFVRELRSRLHAGLELDPAHLVPELDLPERIRPMSSSATRPVRRAAANRAAGFASAVARGPRARASSPTTSRDRRSMIGWKTTPMSRRASTPSSSRSSCGLLSRLPSAFVAT